MSTENVASPPSPLSPQQTTAEILSSIEAYMDKPPQLEERVANLEAKLNGSPQLEAQLKDIKTALDELKPPYSKNPGNWACAAMVLAAVFVAFLVMYIIWYTQNSEDLLLNIANMADWIFEIAALGFFAYTTGSKRGGSNHK
jgi:hypothetical protein